MAELLPLLVLLYRDDLRRCTVADLGSGTGLVADLLQPMVGRLITVDQSRAMLPPGGSRREILLADLRRLQESPLRQRSPDLIVSLGTLHHLCDTLPPAADPGIVREAQRTAIADWASLLAPGGKLVVADVGMPDLGLLSTVDLPFGARVARYVEERRPALQEIVAHFDESFVSAIETARPDLAFSRRLQDLSRLESGTVSLGDIAASQMTPESTWPDHAVPIDFFNHVVAQQSIDGHRAHFRSESDLMAAFAAAGLRDVRVNALPTPWKFASEPEAVWFVAELFGLGAESVLGPEYVERRSDFALLREGIQEYLGMHRWLGDAVYVNWLLLFASGEA